MWFLGLSWVATIIATVISGIALVVGLKTANGAPQEAAIAAVCAAFVVIPYVFTRAIEGLALTGRRPVREEPHVERDPTPPKRGGIDRLSKTDPVFRDGAYNPRTQDDGGSPKW